MLTLIPCASQAESLSEGIGQVISTLDTSALEAALKTSDPFAATGGFTATLSAIARGEMTLDFQQVLDMLGSRFLTAVRTSLWRLTRLMAPAMLWSILRRLTGRSSETGKVVCQLCVCVFLTQDLAEHITLASTAVTRMSDGMQGLFPLLLTMMAAVGGSSGSALMQPAIVASASAMTGLIREVTIPLATAAAILTMLCHLGDGIRVGRLASFVQQCATWSLGICFTVFIGVLSTRAVTAAALDGVTLRTAKYALSNLIPVVGGLFADTVDTLVGSGMLVQGALGVTGLMLIASYAMAPLCQTLAAAMMYRLSSALMQPVSDGALSGCIHDFGRVLMLLFIIQLCAAAMFLMLIAQLIAVSGMTMMLR
ncbi:MAG: stage III sporulation protein AE [Clostridia bacterium]|nr:stage III sporulation protein AE [Clostridia bacterium]